MGGRFPPFPCRPATPEACLTHPSPIRPASRKKAVGRAWFRVYQRAKSVPGTAELGRCQAVIVGVFGLHDRNG